MNKMNDYIEAAYVVQAKNTELLMQCTSGGFFTTIARAFVEDGGYVCGAVYGDNFEVTHIITNQLDEVRKFAGSKYVQSNLGDTYLEIGKLLTENNKILFCSTPCQISGLKKFLLCKGIDQSNLYLIDLVCHGVPSPDLWKAYLDYAVKKRGLLKSVNFRSKYLGYHTSVMEEINVEEKRFVGSARTHLMSKIFFSNIADRPCCYKCQFKTIKRDSDLTIFDSWHAAILNEEIQDNDRGYTNVIVQSKKGYQLFGKYMKLFNAYSCDYKKAIKLDGIMATKSVAKNKDREKFYKSFSSDGLEKAVDQLIPISLVDHLIEKIKIIIKRSSILKKWRIDKET